MVTREKYSRHMTKKSKSDEHYTPENILKLAREILEVDRFDLDVANNVCNSTNSLRSFTKYKNGLDKSWECESLWCNPPFSLNKQFSLKLVEELPRVKKAVWLAKCDTRPMWARLLIDNACGVIFNKEYVQFNSDNNAPFGTLLYLFGDIDLKKATQVCNNTEYYKLYVST